MKHRRASLGLSQRHAALRADVSPTTWGSLETHHQPVSPITAAAMSKALGWTSDSIARMIDGGEPTDTDGEEPPTLEERITAVEEGLLRVVRMVEDLSRGRRRGR